MSQRCPSGDIFFGDRRIRCRAQEGRMACVRWAQGVRGSGAGWAHVQCCCVVDAVYCLDRHLCRFESCRRFGVTFMSMGKCFAGLGDAMSVFISSGYVWRRHVCKIPNGHAMVASTHLRRCRGEGFGRIHTWMHVRKTHNHGHAPSNVDQSMG